VYIWSKPSQTEGASKKRPRTDSPHSGWSRGENNLEAQSHGSAETTCTPSGLREALEGYEFVSNPKAFFKKGRVFMTPWSETKGITESQGRSVEATEPTFTDTAWFAVVKPKAGHCVCLRINTYSGQGTTRSGVVASEHAAVVPVVGTELPEVKTFKAHPQGEPLLTKDPIYVKIENLDITIDPMSRINFGKPYTVEYNVMVRNIGRVYGESIARMEEYFAESLGLTKPSNTSNTSKEQSVSRAEATPARSVPYGIRQLQRNFIAGDPERGFYGTLDTSYRMRSGAEAKSFFVLGRVFAMLYTEAASAAAQVAPDDDAFTIVRYGEHVYTQIRRFVVVSVRRNFVLACAVSTYRNQGTLKHGCDSSEHALIYNTGTDPETCYLPGEKERGLKDPIQVHPADRSTYLVKESRVRFGKIYAIEWNIKVKDIGLVVNEDLHRLVNHHLEEERRCYFASE
jgi:hypothetical protein